MLFGEHHAPCIHAIGLNDGKAADSTPDVAELLSPAFLNWCRDTVSLSWRITGWTFFYHSIDPNPVSFGLHVFLALPVSNYKHGIMGVVVHSIL
ncbi:hypothetical protein XELAEV_18018881mg [Xenopus laevis]|uniref:Uncharacterized protein n=1 Tax=Xenopus laevis TaxID=8355 RepID=A0A974DE01_XENLA|nr:hypothetical protein XELAEV_18018881mg [Xenopus laevis]